MTIQPERPGILTARTYAETLDRQDPLARFRDEFHFPRRSDGSDEVYLMGNSLGLAPKRTAALVQDELERWQAMAVRGHEEGPFPWMPYHEFLTDAMARIVGGNSDEVVVMNSLTVNLHLMMATFYRPTPKRHQILIEPRAFPSDQYAVESQIRWHGRDPKDSLIVAHPADGGPLLSDDELCDRLEREGERIALLLLPGVQYFTGQVFDMARIAAVARRQGILVGFDLAHAAGNVELNLHEWNVDFAVWCCYKYLNSGPGAVGGCFVHRRHVADQSATRLAGWWGHDKQSRFQMPSRFDPIPTAEGWQVSNPPIFSLAAIRAALSVFDEAGGVAQLRKKSVPLTGYLIDLLDAELSDVIQILTPREPARRGCQLSLRSTSPLGSRELHGRLAHRGIATDCREPDVLRAAPVPLYNSYQDVWQFVDALRECTRGGK